MERSNDAAIIEIIEDAPTEPGPGVYGIIKPNKVCINGIPLWAPSGEPITVHGVTVNSPRGDDEVLQVTLTLFARRVFLGHAKESPETPERRVADARQRLEQAQRDLEDAQEAARSE